VLDIDIQLDLGTDTNIDLTADFNIIAVALTFVDTGDD